jgi:hypothetical protein
MNRPVLVALLVLAAVAPAAVPASSPPEPLCSVCDDGFERAAAEQGLSATVTRSEVTVEVREDGTGRWTVRNRLKNGSVADRLRDDSDRLDEIVHTALGERYRKPDPARISNVSAEVRARTLVVTFDYSQFADRVGGGVLLIDYVHAPGRESYGLVADRFAVVGPEGSRVLKSPATGRDDATEVTTGRNGTATGTGAGEMTWANHDERDGYHVDSYVEDTYVAFGPREGLAQTAALRIALAGRTLQTALGNLALLVPAGIALAVGFGGYRSVAPALFNGRQATRLAGGILALGLLAIVHPFYAGSVPLVNNEIPAVVALGVGYALVGGTALAVVSFRRGDTRRVPWWWLLAPALATPPVAALALVLLSYPETFREVSETVLLAMPLAGVFPLGYAIGSDTPSAQRRAAATVLVLVAALPVRFVSLTEAAALDGLVAILATALTVLGVLFGAPLYLLGGSLARACEEK